MSVDADPGHNGAASAWRVSVGGKVYGPYTQVQMEGFVVEGRIAAHSIVASGEQGPWLAASDDPLLANLFMRALGAMQSQPAKGRAIPVTDSLYVTDAKTHGFNYVVIADIKTRSGYGFERELAKLGESYRLSMTVFLLRSDFVIAQVRNALTPHLGKTDSLLVVEANQGKSAWFNLGAQAESQIRKIWHKGP